MIICIGAKRYLHNSVSVRLVFSPKKKKKKEQTVLLRFLLIQRRNGSVFSTSTEYLFRFGSNFPISIKYLIGFGSVSPTSVEYRIAFGSFFLPKKKKNETELNRFKKKKRTEQNRKRFLIFSTVCSLQLSQDVLLCNMFPKLKLFARGVRFCNSSSIARKVIYNHLPNNIQTVQTRRLKQCRHADSNSETFTRSCWNT